MKVWLDANVLVALIIDESTSDSIAATLENLEHRPLVSDLAVAEASAAVARLARTGEKTRPEAETLFEELDLWVASASESVRMTPDDLADAITLVRQPDLALLTPDALHIAGARRLGLTLITLDKGMARAAKALGVDCMNPTAA